jgi:hypothetical protein
MNAPTPSRFAYKGPYEPKGDLSYRSPHAITVTNRHSHGDRDVHHIWCFDVIVDDGSVIVEWSSHYVDDCGWCSESKPWGVEVTHIDDPGIPYGYPGDEIFRGWGPDADRAAASEQWDRALRDFLTKTFAIPDCEDCGKPHSGDEWEITDRLLCYDCARESTHSVPHHWHFDGE